MKPSQLRRWMQKYGNLGVLVAGAYLLTHSVFQRRRRWASTSLPILALGMLFCLMHAKQQHFACVSSPHFAIPSTPISPPEEPVKTEPEEEISDYRPIRPLLTYADKVATLSGNLQTYCWLDRQRLLLFFREGGDDTDSKSGWQGYAECYSLDTGQRTRLKGLTRLLNRIGGTPQDFVPSPDGKWLNWNNAQTADGWRCAVFACLDGSHYQEGDQDKFSQTYWLNNHLWAEWEVRSFDRPLYVNVHDVEHPNGDKSYRQDSWGAKRLSQRYREMAPHTFEVMVPGPPDAFEIGEYGQEEHPGGEDKLLHTFLVHLPSSLHDIELLASPQRDRVLYSFQCRVRRGTPQDRENVSVEALWSSRADGSDLHEIGYVCNQEAHLSNVKWMPDGKHISFRYQDTFYTIPLE